MRSQGCQSRASVSFMSPSPARVDDVGEGAAGPQQGPEILDGHGSRASARYSTTWSARPSYRRRNCQAEGHGGLEVDN
jgi:hypothetical protein